MYCAEGLEKCVAIVLCSWVEEMCSNCAVQLCRYMRDSLMEYARTVVIPLQHGIGRFIKLQLDFDVRWILISEVQFESGLSVITCNIVNLTKSDPRKI